MRDLEHFKQYNRKARQQERQDAKLLRTVKEKLRSCSDIANKVDTLKQSTAFNDVGLAIELLIKP